jgi:plastocyanin
MRRAPVLAVTLAALVLPWGAQAAEAPTRTISMPGKLYDPASVDVLVGTTVTWKNEDSGNHTATADDGDVFASGFIPPGGSYSFTFAKEGRYRFHCSIHRFMRGEVDVFGLVLAGPDGPVAPGASVVFAGLAPPGTSTVVVQGSRTPVTVKARADGSFVARVPVHVPTAFRARAGSLSSPRVAVVVRPRVIVARAGATVRARTAPARPGAVAILQAYDRERFAWVPVKRGKLDARSAARFTVGPGLDRVRVKIRGAEGWADATSRAILLQASR